MISGGIRSNPGPVRSCWIVKKNKVMEKKNSNNILTMRRRSLRLFLEKKRVECINDLCFGCVILELSMVIPIMRDYYIPDHDEGIQNHLDNVMTISKTRMINATFSQVKEEKASERPFPIIVNIGSRTRTSIFH